MSAAFRSHGRGTLVLKGTYAGVRVERSTGTNDAKRLDDLRAMCRTLADAGRVDVLEQLRDGGLKLLDCWRHYRAGDWSRIPTAEHLKPLKAALETWRRTVPGDRHRQDLGVAERQILAAARTGATIADLPATIAALRIQYDAKGAGRHFNKLRDAASAFLKQTVTRQHALYQSVRAIEPLPVTRHFGKHPQTPASAQVIAQALGGAAGKAWWILCCTGMGPDEYFEGKWTVEDDVVHVKGTKRAGRDRLIPRLVDVEPPELGAWGLRSALKRSGLGVKPYDARRSFANWLEQAGIWETHQQAYMGHGPRTITDLYRRHELVLEHLDRDRATLLAFIAGGISGGTAQGAARDDAVTRAGLEPATYGLKVRTKKSAGPQKTQQPSVDPQVTPRDSRNMAE